MNIESMRADALAKAKEIKDLASGENVPVANAEIGAYCDAAVKDFFSAVSLVCEIASSTPGFQDRVGHMRLLTASDYGCPEVGNGWFKWAIMDYDHVCAFYSNRPENCDGILSACEVPCGADFYSTHMWKRDGWLILKGQADRTRNRAKYFLGQMNRELDRLRKGQAEAVAKYAVASKTTYVPLVAE